MNEWQGEKEGDKRDMVSGPRSSEPSLAIELEMDQLEGWRDEAWPGGDRDVTSSLNGSGRRKSRSWC